MELRLLASDSRNYSSLCLLQGWAEQGNEGKETEQKQFRSEEISP